MTVERKTSTGIALNVTRTRVTVLVFNLTIISLMFSIMVGRGPTAGHDAVSHLTSSVALFVGFCLTLLGLWLLLFSQDWDAEGLSRPWSFTLGAMTNYLALSHTVTAFMHEYLLAMKLAVEALPTVAAEGSQSLVGLDVLGDTALLALPVMGGAIWALMTYVAPLNTILVSPIHGGRQWLLASYYCAIQLPSYWVYAGAWHLQYVPVDQPTNMLGLFAMQFVQPLLWFR